MAVVLSPAVIGRPVCKNSAAVKLRDRQAIVEACPMQARVGRFVHSAVVTINNCICIVLVKHDGVMVAMDIRLSVKWVPERHLRPTIAAVRRFHEIDSSGVNVV